MASISSLRRKRSNIQGSITTFTRVLDHWKENEEDRDSDYLQAALETMQRAFFRFPEVQDEIEELDESECNKRESVETSYDIALARARKYLREENQTDRLTEVPARSATAMSRNHPSPVTLPTIVLPRFDGSVEGWSAFFDIFSSLIDKNEELPPVRKLQYLRLSLTEGAARSIQSLETTGQNYEVALSILKKKYKCTRRTLLRHWAILCEYPRLPKDSSSALTQLLHTVHRHIGALETLGAPVHSWDIPLSDLILTKVSPNIAWQWELTLNDDKMPSYKDLLAFLEKRANCVEFSSGTDHTNDKIIKHPQDSNRQRRNKSASAQAFVNTSDDANAKKKVSNTKYTCAICTRPHSIYKCDTFLAMSVDAREKTVSNASLCFNCLARGHSAKECRSIACHKCKRRHHTLLHETQEHPQPSTEPRRANSMAGIETPIHQA